MAEKIVITIGRQFGSGGHAIGERVAALLGIPFYDKELLEEASKNSGITRELFEKADERSGAPLLYGMAGGLYSFGGRVAPGAELSLSERMHLSQSDAIRRIAERGSCVIVGRCSDYVLAEDPDAVHVFVYASPVARTERIMALEGLGEKQARARIAKVDRQRSSYYNYYTGNTWGEIENYDLAIDSSCVGIEKTAELIAAFARSR